MSYAGAATAYRQNAILTASPEKLVKLLYEGAIRQMERARIAIADPATARSAGAGEAIGRAMAIVGELRGSLNMEVGGELADNLDGLYGFVLDQLGDANMNREPAGIESGLRVLRTLKEGWDGVLPA